MDREPFRALAIHPRRPLVAGNALPRRFQGGRPDDLIHQTEPLTPPRVWPSASPWACFDAVFRRRHHAFRPDRGFGPPQPATFVAGGLCPLLSPCGHCRNFRLSHPDLSHPASCLPSLGPVLLPGLSTVRLGCGTMKALTPGRLTRPPGLSAYTALPSRHSVLNHVGRPLVALVVVAAPEVVPGFAIDEQARHTPPPKQVRHPTDCRFVSGCSPPRLACAWTTQLPSTTKLRHPPARTCTAPTWQLHGRTHPGESRDLRCLGPGFRRDDV